MSEADTVPDDVRKLARKAFADYLEGDQGIAADEALIGEIEQAIMADRAAWNRRSPDWIEEAAKVAESMFSVDGFATADVIGMHVRDGQKAAAREIAAAIRALKEK